MKAKGYKIVDYRIGEVHEKDGTFHWSEIAEKYFCNYFESAKCKFDKDKQILYIVIS